MTKTNFVDWDLFDWKPKFRQDVKGIDKKKAEVEKGGIKRHQWHEMG